MATAFFGGSFYNGEFYSTSEQVVCNYFGSQFFGGPFFGVCQESTTLGYVPSKRVDLITPQLYQQDREVLEFIITMVTQYIG